MPKPLAVIPSYLSRLEDLNVLVTCLQSLKATTTPEQLDILVVDDGSPAKNVVAALEERCRTLGVELILREENVGFSQTVNVGLQKALDEGRDAILINADLETPWPGWLELMQKQRSPDGKELASIVGGLLTYGNGLIQFAGTSFSYLNRTFFHRYQFGPGDLPEAQGAMVCPVTGAFQFLRHECLEGIGIYDEHFSMGFEDVDMCVAGETPVLTAQGWQLARDLHGQVQVYSLDGVLRDSDWFEKEPQRLWKVVCEDGTSIFVTADHRWPVSWSPQRGGVRWVTTEQLQGRKVILPSPQLQIRPDPEGVRHGFVFGDGTRNTGRPSAKVVSLPSAPQKQEFIKEWFPSWSEYRNGCVAGNSVPGRFKDLPLKNARADYWAGFIAGYIAADGCLVDRACRLSSIDRDALLSVEAQAQSLGLRLGGIRRIERETQFGGNPMYELRFPADVLRANPWLLLRPDQQAGARPGSFTQRRTLRVVEVLSTDRVEPVYCCEEPVNHAWITAGGIATGNCLRTWKSGRSVVYQAGIRAVHHESFFRGRGDPKVRLWEAESWMYFCQKWANQNFAEFIPDLI